MKLRNRASGSRIAVDMTPMIDVVFQLLIFFMCTLKMIEPEGDFDISMPLGAPMADSVTDAELPPFKVRMEADANGELVNLSFNGENLGGGLGAISSLNSKVFRSITALQAIGSDQLEKQEVEIPEVKEEEKKEEDVEALIKKAEDFVVEIKDVVAPGIKIIDTADGKTIGQVVSTPAPGTSRTRDHGQRRNIR
ncbi:MAG: biopolymer transporter ExbD [Planctomycetota bacterium]